jgi:hypothetical protein
VTAVWIVVSSGLKACAAADASRARSRAAPRVAIGVLYGLPLHGVRLCAGVLHGLPLRVVRLCARDRRRQSEGAAAEIPARNLRAPFNWRSTGALGCRVTLRRYIVSLCALEPCATPGLPHQKPESNASMTALHLVDGMALGPSLSSSHGQGLSNAYLTSEIDT